jgi:hypothetical protein
MGERERPQAQIRCGVRDGTETKLDRVNDLVYHHFSKVMLWPPPTHTYMRKHIHTHTRPHTEAIARDRQSSWVFAHAYNYLSFSLCLYLSLCRTLVPRRHRGHRAPRRLPQFVPSPPPLRIDPQQRCLVGATCSAARARPLCRSGGPGCGDPHAPVASGVPPSRSRGCGKTSGCSRAPDASAAVCDVHGGRERERKAC